MCKPVHVCLHNFARLAVKSGELALGLALSSVCVCVCVCAHVCAQLCVNTHTCFFPFLFSKQKMHQHAHSVSAPCQSSALSLRVASCSSFIVFLKPERSVLVPQDRSLKMTCEGIFFSGTFALFFFFCCFMIAKRLSKRASLYFRNLRTVMSGLPGFAEGWGGLRDI